MHIVSNLLT